LNHHWPSHKFKQGRAWDCASSGSPSCLYTPAARSTRPLPSRLIGDRNNNSPPKAEETERCDGSTELHGLGCGGRRFRSWAATRKSGGAAELHGGASDLGDVHRWERPTRGDHSMQLREALQGEWRRQAMAMRCEGGESVRGKREAA
jgi:hypothetical protein